MSELFFYVCGMFPWFNLGQQQVFKNNTQFLFCCTTESRSELFTPASFCHKTKSRKNPETKLAVSALSSRLTQSRTLCETRAFGRFHIQTVPLIDSKTACTECTLTALNANTNTCPFLGWLKWSPSQQWQTTNRQTLQTDICSWNKVQIASQSGTEPTLCW